MQLKEALRTIQEYTSAKLPSFQVLLACGFHPLHMQTFLQAHCQQRVPERRVLLSTGLYGDLPGTLFQMGESPPQACAVALEWSDLDPRLGFRQLGGWGPAEVSDIVKSVESRLSGLRELLDRTPPNVPIAISCPTLALPPVFHTPACQASEAELRLYRAVDELGLWAASQPNLRVVNRQHLLAVSPWKERFDFKADVLIGLPYTTAHAERLAASLAELLVPGPGKKGLITDLDETLWKGTIGEVGPTALCWDLGSHAQIHGLYQQLLRALADQGVLIAAASKNEPEVVEQGFQRDDLLLPRRFLFPIEAHWQPKSESVARILEVWNVGADSVIFVDDSPTEVAEVKAAFPEMECVQFPFDDYTGFERLMYELRNRFAKHHVTDEDRVRRQSLEAAEAFRVCNRQTSSYEIFMRGAQAEMTADFACEARTPRSLELINKTNQFNLNGVRYTQSEWHDSLISPNSFALNASYRDRYGPLGLIAVLKGHVENKTIFLDTWVMSCRAFARRIEYQCLRVLFERFGAEYTHFAFTPTQRNGPLQEFFATLLGERPAQPFRLSHGVFHAKCPELYHKVEVKL